MAHGGCQTERDQRQQRQGHDTHRRQAAVAHAGTLASRSVGAISAVLAILAVNDALCVAVLWMAAIWVLDPTNAHSIEFFARVKSDGSNRDRVTPASDLTKDETVLRGGARQGECKGSEVAVRLSTQASVC